MSISVIKSIGSIIAASCLLWQETFNEIFFERFRKMRKTVVIIITFMAVALITGCGNRNCNISTENTSLRPTIAGYGVDKFEAGKLLYSNDFSNLDDWVVQIQSVEGYPEPYVKAVDNVLDAFLPGRGCTIWNKNKFKGRIAIIYNVFCPEQTADIDGVRVRDINNFWHATGSKANPNLFDDDVYTGAFGTYHQMNSYYASTGGGGGSKGNETTRFRRYPRIVDGKNVDHIALNDKDGKEEYLITPGKIHTVQLVAFDDIIQYIVDGKVVYQIKYGDEVTVETRDNGKIEQHKAVYNEEDFPVYDKGYFGFRMVRTHHLYSDFRVYRLVSKTGN